MKFFTRRDLSAIQLQNMGLRLTDNYDEMRQGGFGDAVPLSHLGGAKDIVRFITLSASNEPKRWELEAIYECYKDFHVDSHRCLPRLMLYYAAKLDIGDAKARLLTAERQNLLQGLQVAVIEEEMQQLRAFYEKTHGILMPMAEIAKKLPVLADELILNFNEKLKARLRINWIAYARDRDLAYLFLTSPYEERYKSGYDFNNYPLGKHGRHGFTADNILKQYMFLGPDFEGFDTIEKRQAKEQEVATDIFNQIRLIIVDNLNQRLRTHYQRTQEVLDAHLDYPAAFRQAINAVFDVMGQLIDSEALSFDEALELAEHLQLLAENPNHYEAVQEAISDYEMLAGGVLYAYFILVIGWAMRMVTFDSLGYDWINSAEEKISFFTVTDELVSASRMASSVGG